MGMSRRPTSMVLRAPRSRLLLPWQMLQMLRSHRTMEPHGWLYVAAALAGVPVGFAGQAIIEVPWWWGPAVLVVSVWLFFLASAFRTPPGQEPVWAPMLGLVRPEWYARRLDEASARRAEQSGLPLYAAAGWTGHRLLGGTTWQGEEAIAVALAFRRSVEDDSPLIRIESAVPERDVHLGDFLPPTTKQAFIVDGERQAFDVWRGDDAWVARKTMEGYALTIEAQRVLVTEVRLERIHDIRPYLEGSRAFRAERRAYHGH
jgi:hypothetical protein